MFNAVSEFSTKCWSFAVEKLSNISPFLVEKLSLISTITPTLHVLLTRFGFILTSYLLVSFMFYFVTSILKLSYSKINQPFGDKACKVLVVIAHPDDECKYFGPAIFTLTKDDRYVVYILCLSTGNAQKKGNRRKQELWDSCTVLGIRQEYVMLSSSEYRKDGPDNRWKSDQTSRLIAEIVDTLEIDTLITFDKDGVNGHQNHRSIFRAVSFLCVGNTIRSECRVFVLESIGVLRKYSGFLDCLLSVLTSDLVFLLTLREHTRIKTALYKHKSQATICRPLYMIFSRFTFINTYRELPKFQDSLHSITI